MTTTSNNNSNGKKSASSSMSSEATPLMLVSKESSMQEDGGGGETHHHVKPAAAAAAASCKNHKRFMILLGASILIGLILGGTSVAFGTRKRQAAQAAAKTQKIVVVPDAGVTANMSSSGTTTTTATTTTTSTKTTTKSTADDAVAATVVQQSEEVRSSKVEYRPVCEYYAAAAAAARAGTTSASASASVVVPRILQTSMGEPSKPWSLRPCVLAADATTVELNAAAAPDAMLQVNFTTTPATTTTTSTTSKNSSPSRPVILGFGGAFTEAASLNFGTLSETAQEVALELLFGATGLGYSLGRVPIHSCDFSLAPYTFDDVVDDWDLASFDDTLVHDAATIRMAVRAVETYNKAWNPPPASAAAADDDDDDSGDNVAKEGKKQQQPAASTDNVSAFRLFASPWSPPAWMKRPTWEDDKHAAHAAKMTYSAQPNCLRDGVGPDSKYAAAWALYFSKYIAAYEKQGGSGGVLKLWAVTVQNEPEFAAPWEACAYTALNMTDFVAYHLGPVLRRDHPDVKILAFDHNKDHVNAWMMTMLNGATISATTTSTAAAAGDDDDDVDDDDDDDNNEREFTDHDTVPSSSSSSSLAAQYIAGTAYHWYAGGMDRLLDGALGIANLHRLQENLAALGRRDNHILLGSESCHCPTTGYAGGNINIYWDRAERYAHTILADLAAGSQGWVEWNLILDGIGGPNHLGNLCEASILAVPHRARNSAEDMPPLPDFEQHSPMNGGPIFGDERTREELNALGFPAKFLDLGIAVQPMYYYMGHISRHVRPGSVAVPGLVRQSLGSGDTFQPAGTTVAGGGENELARDGIELLLWPCEGSTRQQFRWNLDDSKHIAVLGHDWLGNKTTSCVGREVDKDFMGMRLTQCKSSTAGSFDVIPIADDKNGRYLIRLLNHPKKGDKLCLVILELKNGGGSYGPMGGAQLALGHCSHESAKWKLDINSGRASSTFFADDKNDNEVCITTGWPFLQMGAFLTPNGSSAKAVVILNEGKDSANYALKDDGNVLLTGSIPPRSIQTVLLG